jgi:hypothetical protein
MTVSVNMTLGGAVTGNVENLVTVPVNMTLGGANTGSMEITDNKT